MPLVLSSRFIDDTDLGEVRSVTSEGVRAREKPPRDAVGYSNY
jgi:hypothetical protein